MLVADARDEKLPLRDYLVEVILQTTLVGSLVGILAGIAFGLSGALSFVVTDRFEDYRWLLAGLNSLGQLLSIAGAAYIVRMASDALAVARKLNPSPQTQEETA